MEYSSLLCIVHKHYVSRSMLVVCSYASMILLVSWLHSLLLRYIQSMFRLANPCYSIGLTYLWIALILFERVRVVFTTVCMVLRLVDTINCE